MGSADYEGPYEASPVLLKRGEWGEEARDLDAPENQVARKRATSGK